MLGLLLAKDDTHSETAGMYHRYKLGAATSRMPDEIASDVSCLDAIAVHDQFLYLPLGLVVAK